MEERQGPLLHHLFHFSQTNGNSVLLHRATDILSVIQLHKLSASKRNPALLSPPPVFQREGWVRGGHVPWKKRRRNTVSREMIIMIDHKLYVTFIDFS